LHYSVYRTSMQLLQNAIQPLMLVPLDEMEELLVRLIEASWTETKREQRKMRSAEGRLELIRLSQVFSVGVRSL